MSYGGGFDSFPMPPPADPEQQRCLAACFASARAPFPPAEPRPPEPPVDSEPTPNEEFMMQQESCKCANCQPRSSTFEVLEFEAEGSTQAEAQGLHAEAEGEDEGWGAELGEQGEHGPFGEAEEIALAAELLSVSSEEELDQFLGKMFKGIKKVGSFIGKVAKPFSGVLKAIAKKALPFVGGALGSLIPIPGVGTAVGTALGSAVSKALEAELEGMEFEGLELEDREFEAARRFVRIAGSAAQQLGNTPPGAQPLAAVEAAVARAAKQHLPQFAGPTAASRQRTSGQWKRHGNTLVLHGA
jgi:hypothetical protein